MTRNRVEMVGIDRRATLKLAGALRRAHEQLARIQGDLPDYATAGTFLREERIVENLDAWANHFEERNPILREWRRTARGPYEALLIQETDEGTTFYTGDGSLPLPLQVAVEVHREVRDLYQDLLGTGLSPREADRLTREGLVAAGVKADRAIRFEWTELRFDPDTHEIENQPMWAHGVGVGGLP